MGLFLGSLSDTLELPNSHCKKDFDIKQSIMPELSETFPQDPVLAKLLEAAQHVPGSQLIIKDVFGFEKTYPEMLSDILVTRNDLRTRLPPQVFDERSLLCDETPYVAACTRTGYEFVVAFFAVRALGGAFLPLGE